MEELTAFQKMLGIRVEGDFYVFQDYKYKDLGSAVEYAVSITGLSASDVEGLEFNDEDAALGITLEDGYIYFDGILFNSYEEARKRAIGVKESVARELRKKELRRDQNLSSVMVVTTNEVPTFEICELLGPVRGGTVRAKNVARDFLAEVKNVVGGEIKGYTELLAEAREEALYRMKKDAEDLGANAVIGFRFSTATIEVGSAEVTAYGTAVKVKKKKEVEA